MVYAFLYQAMDKLLAFIFIPVYWPQIKQWLFMEVYQDHSFQVDSHSVPNAPVGIVKHIYIRKKWRDLDKKWVFLQMGAKSSTKHVSRGKELASPWVLTTYFGCGNAGMPIHTLTQEPGTCNEFIRKFADAFGSFRYSLDTVSHSRQEGLWEFVPEPVWCKRTSDICLTNSRGHMQNRVFSVYARGCSPSSPPSQLKQYGQFSHISTCITLRTSHNWSTTVTGYIRCFST